MRTLAVIPLATTQALHVMNIAHNIENLICNTYFYQHYMDFRLVSKAILVSNNKKEELKTNFVYNV